MERNLTVYRDAEELAEKFADFMVALINNSGQSPFHVALSGGSTPQLLFRRLAEKYPDAPIWQKTHFWSVDERMVPLSDPQSNFGIARMLLFSKIGIPAANLHPINGTEDPEKEASDYSKKICSQLAQRSFLPRFDLVVLGMGEDGHTASIFPDQMPLLHSREVCAVAYHPVSRQPRVTLTGEVICAAAVICFLVTGGGKAEKLQEIFQQSGVTGQLPAAHIKPKEGEMYWFSDHAAARFIIS